MAAHTCRSYSPCVAQRGVSELVISDASEEDVGNYICTATLKNVTTAVTCQVLLGGTCRLGIYKYCSVGKMTLSRKKLLYEPQISIHEFLWRQKKPPHIQVCQIFFGEIFDFKFSPSYVWLLLFVRAADSESETHRPVPGVAWGSGLLPCPGFRSATPHSGMASRLATWIHRTDRGGQAVGNSSSCDSHMTSVRVT